MSNLSTLPELRELNGHKALYVDGKPFLMLGLQWDCDSCYNADTMIGLMAHARRMGCNMASLLLAWRCIEPVEGQFDFSILEAMLRGAREHDLRIVLVWFGTYKNACLNYAPDWVRDDQQRFRRAVDANGRVLHNFACYNCQETMVRDSDAVCAVFEYLKQHDTDHRVILFQVNNETGLLGTARCHCDKCNAMFEEQDFSARYGDRADEAFSATRILIFNEYIAERAKKVLPLPCYMNAWLVGLAPGQRPGTYPSGGPVHTVLDIYRAGMHYVDFVAPDVYDTGYKNLQRRCKEYTFPNNLLFIAEHASGEGCRAELNVYYAIGQHGAIGFDPWAIDCAPGTGEPLVDRVSGRWSEEAYELLYSYAPIRNAMVPIALRQHTNALRHWVQESGDYEDLLDFEDARVCVQYPKHRNSRGLVLRMDAKHYVVVGCRANVQFCDLKGKELPLRSVQQGWFEGETFVAERRTRREREDKTMPFRLQDPGVYMVELDTNA